MRPPPPGSDALALPGPLTEPEVLSPLRVARARGRVRGTLALLGPAFVAAVAYIDPGNFATNHRRREVRLPARVGHRRGQPDRDARAVHVGEDRDRVRAKPA